jgi:hypothetical protein
MERNGRLSRVITLLCVEASLPWMRTEGTDPFHHLPSTLGSVAEYVRSITSLHM